MATKRLLLTNPQSCLTQAHDQELVFLLTARDAAAPDAIRAWAMRRTQLGLNNAMDDQIVEAIGIADLMEEQRPDLRRMLGKSVSPADAEAELRRRAEDADHAGGG